MSESTVSKSMVRNSTASESTMIGESTLTRRALVTGLALSATVGTVTAATTSTVPAWQMLAPGVWLHSQRDAQGWRHAGLIGSQTRLLGIDVDTDAMAALPEALRGRQLDRLVWTGAEARAIGAQPAATSVLVHDRCRQQLIEQHRCTDAELPGMTFNGKLLQAYGRNTVQLMGNLMPSQGVVVVHVPQQQLAFVGPTLHQAPNTAVAAREQLSLLTWLRAQAVRQVIPARGPRMDLSALIARRHELRSQLARG